MRDFVERGRPDEEQFDILTPRELQVLKLIAEAHTSKEIAQELLITSRPSSGIGRTSSTSWDERPGRATRYAIRRGLIQP